MSYGKHSLAVASALAVSALLVLGGALAAALRAWLWTPALVLGLAGMGAVVAFLWRSLTLAASRVGDPTRERDRAALLALALDAGEDGVTVVDAEGRILHVSLPCLRLWGIPGEVMAAGDLARAQDLILAQLKDPDAFLARGQALRATPGESSFDVLDLWDGRIIERHSSPHRGPGGVALRVWRYRDITGRARADLFVHRLSQAVEQSPISIVITDTAGTLEFVNARFSQVTGYALDEALGNNPRIVKSGLTHPKVYEELWTAITSGRVWEGEFQNRKRDGQLFWERATIAPLRDPDGVITHFLGLKEDITRQKQLEQQLRHSQKLEAVGLLAGGVAHDFNNVLQVINGYGALMQLGQGLDEANRNALTEILKAAERAAQLTHSLLAFSRKQVMNPRTLDLNVIVGNVEKLLRRIIGADIRLVVTRPEAAQPVHVDLGQMEQVLLNLATNARDAMPGGGTLALATGPFRIDEAFHSAHGFGQAGDYAMLEVRDSGEGMDEATQKRIFDPFFTTRELGRGTGLGLATVFGIVKQHKGYIFVESGAGEGSAFRVLLPRAAAAPAAAEQPGLAEGGVRGTETVLVVEDEPAVRAMAEVLLKNHGYAVLLAADGQEAVEVFRANRDSIHLILMDIIMPRKSGRQAFDEIRLDRPAVKVLFMSGYTADFIKGRGELEQGMELLMKPVQPLVLLRRIRELLDRPPSPPASGGPPPPPVPGAVPAPPPVSRG